MINKNAPNHLGEKALPPHVVTQEMDLHPLVGHPGNFVDSNVASHTGQSSLGDESLHKGTNVFEFRV